VHEIKHDGYRLMAPRDALSVGIRLLTRNGHDWASRYPLIVEGFDDTHTATMNRIAITRPKKAILGVAAAQWQ
jgi:ATP-dependent DNA ligase